MFYPMGAELRQLEGKVITRRDGQELEVPPGIRVFLRGMNDDCRHAIMPFGRVYTLEEAGEVGDMLDMACRTLGKPVHNLNPKTGRATSKTSNFFHMGTEAEGRIFQVEVVGWGVAYEEARRGWIVTPYLACLFPSATGKILTVHVRLVSPYKAPVMAPFGDEPFGGPGNEKGVVVQFVEALREKYPLHAIVYVEAHPRYALLAEEQDPSFYEPEEEDVGPDDAAGAGAEGAQA